MYLYPKMHSQKKTQFSQWTKKKIKYCKDTQNYIIYTSNSTSFSLSYIRYIYTIIHRMAKNRLHTPNSIWIHFFFFYYVQIKNSRSHILHIFFLFLYFQWNKILHTKIAVVFFFGFIIIKSRAKYTMYVVYVYCGQPQF